MTYDQRPPSRKAIEVAADCALRGEAEAAAVIRDLLELARAQEKLLCAYRVGKRPADKTLDTIGRLIWRIGQ